MFSSHHDCIDPAYPWQFRVIRASLATTTGSIVRAILAKQTRSYPEFGRTADITKDGWFISTLKRAGIIIKPCCYIGTVEDVRDNLRRLADHCHLTDAEREALFEQLRKWIRRDYRATSEVA